MSARDQALAQREVICKELGFDMEGVVEARIDFSASVTVVHVEFRVPLTPSQTADLLAKIAQAGAEDTA